MQSKAAEARESVGLDIYEAARHARISVDYLRRVERGHGAPFALACRLAHIYGTGIDLFLKTKGGSRAREHVN